MDFNATFFIVLISFLLFTYIMNKILYEPVSRIIRERNGLIDAALKEADKDDSQAQDYFQKRDEKLSLAAQDARTIVAKKVDSANYISANLINDAKTNSAKEIVLQKEKISNESDKIKSELDEVVKNISEEIVKKVLN